MQSLLAVLDQLTTLAPDALPLFIMAADSYPTEFARIIDPPGADSSLPKNARQQAKEIQGAGLWNTLGLIRVLVAAYEMAEGDRVTDDVADIGRVATEIMDKAESLAPELVLLALEKLPVSYCRK